MQKTEPVSSHATLKAFRIIFIICAIYFLLMGTGLILFPHFIIKGFSEGNANPVIIGMLRGAGGSVIPYSIFYILISIDPYRRSWALYGIFFANVIAIALDLASVISGEYKLSYAMIDIPFELLSIIGIVIIWIKMKIPEIK
jgi:hypothetical protein